MILKNTFFAAICAMLLACGGMSFAAEYRPGDFLTLDLSKAVLSPKPLGPPAQFAPLPIEADSGGPVAQSRPEPKAAPGNRVAKISVVKTRIAQVRVEKPRRAARTKLARRHSNPLDAEAFDRRIQVWPCKTGGICGWQR